jgi:hypothetical protein
MGYYDHFSYYSQNEGDRLLPLRSKTRSPLNISVSNAAQYFLISNTITPYLSGQKRDRRSILLILKCERLLTSQVKNAIALYHLQNCFQQKTNQCQSDVLY